MVVRNKAKAKTVELTFNHEDNVNSITPEIIELERIFVWLVNNVVPPPYRQAMAERQYVITTGYNDNRRKAKVGAYFAKDSWKILSDGTPVHAIHMFGNAFALDTIQLVTLLAHETVHAANHANGIQDCTKDRHTKPIMYTCFFLYQENPTLLAQVQEGTLPKRTSFEMGCYYEEDSEDESEKFERSENNLLNE